MAKKLRHVTETVNTTTGEITSIQKTFSIKADTTEQFYITFLTGLNAIDTLSRPSDIKTLGHLCARAEYNTGVVRISGGIRRELEARLGISTQSLSNSLGRLKIAGLISGKGGDFEINPHCFWKGTTDERNRLLRNKQADITFKYGM